MSEPGSGFIQQTYFKRFIIFVAQKGLKSKPSVVRGAKSDVYQHIYYLICGE